MRISVDWHMSVTKKRQERLAFVRHNYDRRFIWNGLDKTYRVSRLTMQLY